LFAALSGFRYSRYLQTSDFGLRNPAPDLGLPFKDENGCSNQPLANGGCPMMLVVV